MVNSMTGFASVEADIGDAHVSIEIKSVNGRGLDIRTRLGEYSDILEPELKARLTSKLSRGTLQVNLKSLENTQAQKMVLDEDQLKNMIMTAQAIEQSAKAQGLAVEPARIGDFIGLQNLMRPAHSTATKEDLLDGFSSVLDELVIALSVSRKEEGEKIAQVLQSQLSTIQKLVAKSKEAAGERTQRMAAKIKENASELLEIAEGVDPQRLEAELALIAIKADVSEELDRLDAHVKTANELFVKSGPIGRKLDFLMQEFNREANTLCAKAGSVALTNLGLELKVTIDQMREQVQNVE